MDLAQTKAKIIIVAVIAFSALGLTQCAKPILYGKVQQVSVVRKGFNASYDQVYAATQWALSQLDYSTEEASKQRGTFITDWKPSTPDSHYVQVFGRPDYGTVGAYYHLDLALYQEHGKIQVAIRSISKSVVSHLHSTLIEEKNVLDRIEEYLRGKEIEVTNLGITK